MMLNTILELNKVMLS